MTAAEASTGQLAGGTRLSPAARGSAGAAGPAGTTAIAGKRLGDEAAAGPDAAGEGGKKSKKKLVLILVAVLLLGGAGYMVKGRSHKVVYKPGQPVPAGKVVPLGTLTVNTADGHIVQVGIDLQLTAVAESKTVTTDQPQLQNAAILDLGQQTYAGLMAPSGRTALQQELVTSFQQVLGPVDGAAPQVTAVYFTSFILQ